MCRIISIANQKGGVGKTTTAVNISAVLAKKGKKVLLIDADPQGNATSGVGINKECENSVYDILINDIDVEKTVQETNIKNLKVCPSNIDLAGAEVELVSQISREQRLKEKLDLIKDEFDFIIIDCPPSLGLITLNAFTASNSVLIPVQCEYYALEGLGQLLNTINLVKKHLNKNLEIEGAVLTMYDMRTNLSNQVVKEVKHYFEDKVYKTVIPRNIKVSEAPRALTTTIYILMGWLVVIATYPLIKIFKQANILIGLLWLLLGGIFYTIGGIMYGLKWPKINFKNFGFHEIFHIFVILGSACHFWFILHYVLIV